MNSKEKINTLLENALDGIITTKQVNAAGVHRGILRELVENGELYQYSRGIYILKDAWEDDFYLLQCKYKRGIFSHDTALYLLGYCDRTPAQYTMTFPKGYNSPSLKQECINIKRVIPENYSFGIQVLQSPCGNPILVYDLERTLCDILRGSGSDIQIVNVAMKKYAYSQEKDIHKLMRYAEKLHVKPKILHYLEVLL